MLWCYVMVVHNVLAVFGFHHFLYCGLWKLANRPNVLEEVPFLYGLFKLAFAFSESCHAFSFKDTMGLISMYNDMPTIAMISSKPIR